MSPCQHRGAVGLCPLEHNRFRYTAELLSDGLKSDAIPRVWNVADEETARRHAVRRIVAFDFKSLTSRRGLAFRLSVTASALEGQMTLHASSKA